MDVSVQILGVCGTGEHIHIRASAGARHRDFTLSRAELTAEPYNPEDYETVLRVLLRSFVKERNLSTPAEIRTAVEAHTFKV